MYYKRHYTLALLCAMPIQSLRHPLLRLVRCGGGVLEPRLDALLRFGHHPHVLIRLRLLRRLLHHASEVVRLLFVPLPPDHLAEAQQRQPAARRLRRHIVVHGAAHVVAHARHHLLQEHPLPQHPDGDDRPHRAHEPVLENLAGEGALLGQLDGLQRGGEPGVLQGLPRAQPLLGVPHQELGDEVLGGVGHRLPHGLLEVEGDGHDAVEDALGGGGQEGVVAPQQHIEHHARAPHVHGGRRLDGHPQGAVVPLPVHNQLRRHVLVRAHQARLRAVQVGDVGRAEVHQPDAPHLPALLEQHVLELEVVVHHPAVVEHFQRGEDLLEEDPREALRIFAAPRQVVLQVPSTAQLCRHVSMSSLAQRTSILEDIWMVDVFEDERLGGNGGQHPVRHFVGAIFADVEDLQSYSVLSMLSPHHHCRRAPPYLLTAGIACGTFCLRSCRSIFLGTRLVVRRSAGWVHQTSWVVN
mmetsp:Transcript_28080/g.61462  ORF Transcript_28080/g.61462 Transcript_28080/m.61462 type:complete len:467 (-) Transcript_28080:1542-2942(-)